MWKLIYTNDKHVTKDTNLKNFQFKVTHRILACNYNLKIWKIKENNVCNQCDETDTIEHHLVTCENTLEFWNKIFKWWAQHFETWFQIDTYEIIFGIPNERDEPVVNQINFFILLAKYYIYVCKKKEVKLDEYEFIIECKNRIQIKYHTMVENQTLEKFERIWGDLYNCLM
jgi:hypothetical protein